MKSKLTYRSIATHSLVAAIFVNPYLLYIIADIHRVLTNNTSTVTIDTSLIATMSIISLLALIVSLVAFSIGANSKKRRVIAIAVGLIVLGWALSQIFVPLGLFFLGVAAAIIVFTVIPAKRR
jgi:hypothetical protein